jgi:hypothetical protein
MFKRTIIDAGDQFFARVSGDTAQQPNPLQWSTLNQAMAQGH